MDERGVSLELFSWNRRGSGNVMFSQTLLRCGHSWGFAYFQRSVCLALGGRYTFQLLTHDDASMYEYIHVYIIAWQHMYIYIYRYIYFFLHPHTHIDSMIVISFMDIPFAPFSFSKKVPFSALHHPGVTLATKTYKGPGRVPGISSKEKGGPCLGGGFRPLDTWW